MPLLSLVVYTVVWVGLVPDRFALADAGDSLEDANFAVDSANKAILALTGEEVGRLPAG